MIRRESYCGGRLVKEVDQIHVCGAVPGVRSRYVDGSVRWRLDGKRVHSVEAEAFRIVWDAGHRRHRVGPTARSWPALTLAAGIVLWVLTVLLTLS